MYDINQAPGTGSGGYAPPAAAPTYTQPNPYTHVGTTTNPQPAGYGFKPDAKTIEILKAVHPELADAMICLAVKKFSQGEDYLNYFVQDAFKAQAQEEQVRENPAQTQASAPVAKPQSAVSFDSW